VKVFGARRVFDSGAREICECVIAGAGWGNQHGGGDLLGIIYNEARMMREIMRGIMRDRRGCAAIDFGLATSKMERRLELIVGNCAGAMRNRTKKPLLAMVLVMATALAMTLVVSAAAPLGAQSAAGGQTPMTQAPAAPAQAPAAQVPAAQSPATQPAATQAPPAQTPAPTTPAPSAPASAAQTPAVLAPAQAPTTLAPADDWMKAAGGKQEFDVTSVKLNKSGMPPSGDMPHSNFPLGPGDVYSPNGGLFTATNMPLVIYIYFAYKLNSSQMSALRAQVPKWVLSDNFDIQAKVDGNPSKDQMRMMMQALLADRFKLAAHTETRQSPVYALVLVKPEKFGPQLRAHPADASCSTTQPAAAPGAAPAAPATIDGGYPAVCGGITLLQGSASGRIRIGARDVTMATIASGMTSPFLGVDRPVVDQTGLSGNFDFTVEFSPTVDTPLPPGVNFTPDPDGPTFQEALKDQLGLKLDAQTGSADVFIVDHIEPPSEN
jgi:uncharacterized protein (TIGR03435 family)